MRRPAHVATRLMATGSRLTQCRDIQPNGMLQAATESFNWQQKRDRIALCYNSLGSLRSQCCGPLDTLIGVPLHPRHQLTQELSLKHHHRAKRQGRQAHQPQQPASLIHPLCCLQLDKWSRTQTTHLDPLREAALHQLGDDQLDHHAHLVHEIVGAAHLQPIRQQHDRDQRADG